MSHPACVFLGGKQIGVDCLKALLARNIRPALVVPNRDDTGEHAGWHDSLAHVATEAGLPVRIGAKLSDPAIVAEIKAANPDIIFCIGGTQIVQKELLDIPRLGCLNLHPALLPKYRGRYSTVHAIANGETTHGVTAHWMDEGIDTGPILFQESFPITPDDTAKTVYDTFTTVGTRLFERVVDTWRAGETLVATPQDESQATYYPKGLPNNGEIDWSWDGKRIYDFIRAMTFPPFPPASFRIGDTEMVIIKKP